MLELKTTSEGKNTPDVQNRQNKGAAEPKGRAAETM